MLRMLQGIRVSFCTKFAQRLYVAAPPLPEGLLEWYSGLTVMTLLAVGLREGTAEWVSKAISHARLDTSSRITCPSPALSS